MAAAINSFEELCVDSLVGLLEDFLSAQGSTSEVVPGQETDTETSPRVVVSATSALEAVYQSGNYDLTVEFSARVNVDATDSTSEGNPDSIGQLFGHVMDFLQQPSLQQQLTETGKVLIQGIVIEDQKLDLVDDRRWWKTVNVRFFGFATAG
jgi:hypothetical protein